MTTPTENWPKPFLLQVHEQAVEHGLIFIEPITKSDAASFKQRFYRVRRRSDKSMAAFIRPEYHLVMVGVWEEGDGAGRLPIIYNRKPDGQALPSIRLASGEEAAQYAPAPALAAPLPPELTIPTDDLTIKSGEIDSLVDQLRNAARKRIGGE